MLQCSRLSDIFRGAGEDTEPSFGGIQGLLETLLVSKTVSFNTPDRFAERILDNCVDCLLILHKYMIEVSALLYCSRYIYLMA